jgi:hypothetical protein
MGITLPLRANLTVRRPITEHVKKREIKTHIYKQNTTQEHQNIGLLVFSWYI